MRVLFLILLSFSLLFSANTDKKIKQSKRALSAKKIEYKKMDKQLAVVAKKILKAKKEQKSLAKKLATLSATIKKNEKKFNELQEKEKKILSKLNAISSKIEAKEKKFLDLVAKNFSLALALDELKQPTPDSIVTKEVYELYAKKNSKEIDSLKEEISRLKHKKLTFKMQKTTLEKAISKFVNERKEYETKKEKQDKLVKDLARDKAIYKKRFNKIKASRNRLERKLATLKIIKRKELKREQERERARARRAAQRLAATNRAKNQEVSEDLVTQSYVDEAPEIIAEAPTANYTGGKTISPLKGARLIKKFGTYIDPIYKFKIFNKSVTLKAPYSGSKVRSVLDGKIVFAENSGGMLGKVVIVEHTNGIHTIYAKLSRLAPGIHVGKRLTKGSVIGKVDKSLMFEVTKNNKHMNPMNLIHL